MSFLFLGTALANMHRNGDYRNGSNGKALQAYLLGTVDFEAALQLQRRLHYEVAGNRDQACVVLCEHPSIITVGRQGSRAHILCEPEQLRWRQWRVRWVNRGGGAWLHLPGQLAVYPILPLDRMELDLQGYLQKLNQVTESVLKEFSLRGQVRADRSGIRVNDRLLAALGVAVKDWVSYFGIVFNINPALEFFRLVRCGGMREPPMTSLERERRGRLQASLVRERFVEHLQTHFGFSRVSLFSDHAALRSDGKKRAGSRVAAGGLRE